MPENRILTIDEAVKLSADIVSEHLTPEELARLGMTAEDVARAFLFAPRK